MNAEAGSTGTNAELRRGIARRFIQVLTQFAVQALLLFGAAGTLRWGWGWALIGMALLMVAVNSWFLLHRHPETIVERGRLAENWKAWDRILGLALTLTLFIGVLLVAGLDRRHAWTGALALGWRLLGVAGNAAGSALFSWAMIENAYFSTVVRIQDDRGQAVCTTGPYRLVRHPGYLGLLVQAVGQPLLLGSLWALIPGGLTIPLLILRTALEDRTLREELPGYEAYTRQTRYRLIPGVW